MFTTATNKTCNMVFTSFTMWCTINELKQYTASGARMEYILNVGLHILRTMEEDRVQSR